MFTYFGNVLGRTLLGKAQPEGIHITNIHIKGQTCLSLNPQTKGKVQGHITTTLQKIELYSSSLHRYKGIV
jgi:hypothetical protein